MEEKMKKYVVLTLVLLSLNMVFAKRTKLNFVDQLGPTQRKSFAAAWLETGKAYLKSGDKKDAKASFQYCIKLYPYGDKAAEARKHIKQITGKGLKYNAEDSYKYFIKRAGKLKNTKLKLNNVLMAMELKVEADVAALAADLYYTLGKNDKAAEYAKKALEAGYDIKKFKPEIASLIQ